MPSEYAAFSQTRLLTAVVTFIASVSSFWLLYDLGRRHGKGSADAEAPHPQADDARLLDDPSANLHRSNAIRRRRNHEREPDRANATVPDEENGPETSITRQNTLTADDAATEVSVEGAAPQQDEEAQHMRELMFAISKNKAKNEGFVHRGITCDHCSKRPIVGIRYHCANCPDFDLCEDCEAQDAHLKTHIFYKVKIPAPWGGKQPQPVWYPGEPRKMPAELPTRLKTQLLRVPEVERAGLLNNRLDGLYHQFTCLANTKLTEPIEGLPMAIDRAAFDKAFLPYLGAGYPNHNLVIDRLFFFYDQNKDGLIDFREFVVGTALVHTSDSDDKKKRTFKGLDLNDDGYVSRRDFLIFFRAYYNLSDIIEKGYVKANQDGEIFQRVMEGTTDVDFVKSGRPLTAFFREGGYFRFGQPNSRSAGLKALNEVSDLVPIGDVPVTASSENGRYEADLLPEVEIIMDTWLPPHRLLDDDLGRVLEGWRPLWVRPGNIKLTYSSQAAQAISQGKPYIAEGSPTAHWIAFWARQHTAVSLLVTEEDVVDVHGDHFSAAHYERWKEKLKSFMFVNPILEQVRARICEEIANDMKHRGLRKLEVRSSHHDFYLEGSDETDEEKKLRQDSDKARKFSEDDAELDEAFDQMIASRKSSDADNEDSSENTETKEPRFVGGDAASQTVWSITQQALNELLNPIFGEAEKDSIEARSSSWLRDEIRPELDGEYVQAFTYKMLDLERRFQIEHDEQDADMYGGLRELLELGGIPVKDWQLVDDQIEDGKRRIKALDANKTHPRTFKTVVTEWYCECKGIGDYIAPGASPSTDEEANRRRGVKVAHGHNFTHVQFLTKFNTPEPGIEEPANPPSDPSLLPTDTTDSTTDNPPTNEDLSGNNASSSTTRTSSQDINSTQDTPTTAQPTNTASPPSDHPDPAIQPNATSPRTHLSSRPSASEAPATASTPTTIDEQPGTTSPTTPLTSASQSFPHPVFQSSTSSFTSAMTQLSDVYRDVPYPRDAFLTHLRHLESVALRDEQRGGMGRLSFDEWMRAVGELEDGARQVEGVEQRDRDRLLGRKAVEWWKGWVDWVMF